ncbi:MAG: DUF5343 domain-containing protein [Acidobacteria bacterium]|nr:DUF5343 domain-containing protein [Acidobacteriota bacterium]
MVDPTYGIESEKAVPPYVSYKTFRKFLEDLSGKVPTRVDRSVMASMSGAVQSQLIAALRYLQLISPQGISTEKFIKLANSKGPERQRLLRQILNSSYPYLFKGFDLQRATTQQIEQKFKQAAASGETVRKCVSFFLAAAREAAISLSPHISASRGRRRQRTRISLVPGRVGTSTITESEPIAGEASSRQWAAELLNKFPSFDPAWSDEVKSKWFEDFGRLMKIGRGGNGD